MEINTNQENDDYIQMTTSLEMDDLKKSKSRYQNQESTPFSKNKENTSPNFHKSLKSNELIKKTQDTLNSLLYSHKKMTDYNLKDNSIIYESNAFQNKNENTSDDKLKFSIFQTKNSNKYEEKKINNENDVINNKEYNDKISKTNKNFYTVDHIINNKYSINTEIISHKTLENTISNFKKTKSKSRLKKVNNNEFYFNYKNDNFFENLNSKQPPHEQNNNTNIANNIYNPDNFENKIQNNNLYKLYNNSNIDDITTNKILKNNKDSNSLIDSLSFSKAEEEEKKMLIRIEDEEKKLRELENEKNKLLLEEKERRKNISNSINKQNKKALKKIMKQNKHQNEQKLRNIFLEQEKNKSEIQQLIKNKIQDEEKLNQLERKTDFNNIRNNYNFKDEYKINDDNIKFNNDNIKYSDKYKFNDDNKFNNKSKFNDEYKYNNIDNNAKFNVDYLKSIQEKNNLINQKSIEIFKKLETAKNLNKYIQNSQPEPIKKTNSQLNLTFKEIINSLNKNRPTYRQNKFTSTTTEDSNLIPNAPLTPNGFYRDKGKNNSHNYSGNYSQTRKTYKRSNTQNQSIPKNMKSNLNKNYLATSNYNINGGGNKNNNASYYRDYNYFSKYNTNPYNIYNSINNNYRTEDTINSNYAKNQLRNNNNYERQYTLRRNSYGNIQDIINKDDYFESNDNKIKTQRNFNNNSNTIFSKICSPVIGGEKIFGTTEQSKMNSAFAPWYNSDSNIATCENCNEEKEVYEIDNIYKNDLVENGNYNSYNYSVLKLCPHCKELYQMKKSAL